jgi:predicted 3-demethylubiquinone-9 3-methyltransferase (glyoxalase superfamily)
LVSTANCSGRRADRPQTFSFQIATDDQPETDRYWNAIVANGGQESMCGWCKDKWGISWQITPRVLMNAMAAGGDEAKRAFEAMMDMKKIDVAAIEAARRTGGHAARRAS